MEIVVSGRNVGVPEHFRIRVGEKIGRLERYDHKLTGLDVELVHEPNRRQSKSCQRVTITGRGCEPMVRAEACAQDFYGALDCAVAKLARQLRRSHDRGRITARRRRITAGPDVPAAVGLLEQLPGVDSRGDLVPDDREDEDDTTPPPRDQDDYLVRSDFVDAPPSTPPVRGDHAPALAIESRGAALLARGRGHDPVTRPGSVSDLHHGRSPSAIFGHDSTRTTQPPAGPAADPVPEGDQATGHDEGAAHRCTARNRR
ncbi:ribosome-associated translation inhibitor RaiA [Pseudonocardia sp. RS11V-5]|uniref:ribosome hibernation-promoting factor, HPF/YfiA family n=1 Tax=Pseudonocardia terrae TaxID=2905831 RepID=UPI001E510B18|nr:ribosome-associated translation inhibitor RaiA [Pseudonocardia terrae]MCE3556089.1 ribosome-associated translation inhibitor RaiA [Pseudonocardia terrae]